MNKKLLLAMALTAFTATIVNARSWRINNDVTKKPNFASIGSAIGSEKVQDGDTLYLDPGNTSTSSGSFIVSKRVTIIGCGFTGAQQPYSYASAGALTITADSTKLLGLNVSCLYIGAKSVTVERCKVSGITSNGDKCQYATIRNCYITYNGSIGTVIKGAGKTSNNSSYWIIENCIVLSNGTYTHAIQALYKATIRNNLILRTENYKSYCCLSDIGNSQIINNIIINPYFKNLAVNDVDTDQLNNNVLSSNTRPDYNRCNVLTTDSVFTGDYQEYVLTEDSPARGYGQDGKDCGIFGGLYPYVKGGRPYGHPYFEQYNVSSRPEEGKVNVSLKIKTQNE